MTIFEKTIQIPPEGLSTSGLFRQLQDIAGDQCVELHQSADELRERGLMWVVVRYLVNVRRWPAPCEEVRLETWPGLTRHSMMPRFYRMLDAGGCCLITGSSVWTVVDRQTRKMVNPTEHGVQREGLVTGQEERRPGAPVRMETTGRAVYRVSAADLDENGHMNNTRYYDLAERCIGRVGRHPLQIVTEHAAELKPDEQMTVLWGREGERFYICGEKETPVFRMNLTYGEE